MRRDINSVSNSLNKLSARNLTTRVGNLVLLDKVSITVKQNELIGIVGPSGAGKSTLLKALCGFQPAKEGQVLLDQNNLYTHFNQFKQTIGYVPQDDIIHSSLSVYQTLLYTGLLRFPPDKVDRKRLDALISAVLVQLQLTERKKVKVKRLSGGQRKRVSIAVELLTSPELMFLDEPTSGLDPGLEQKLMQLLKNLSQEGRIIFVTTHIMKSLNLLDLILVMVQGKLAYFGPPDEINNYFNVTHFSDIFDKLNQKKAREWQYQYLNSKFYPLYANR